MPGFNRRQWPGEAISVLVKCNDTKICTRQCSHVTAELCQRWHGLCAPTERCLCARLPGAKGPPCGERASLGRRGRSRRLARPAKGPFPAPGTHSRGEGAVPAPGTPGEGAVPGAWHALHGRRGRSRRLARSPQGRPLRPREARSPQGGPSQKDGLCARLPGLKGPSPAPGTPLATITKLEGPPFPPETTTSPARPLAIPLTTVKPQSSGICSCFGTASRWQPIGEHYHRDY